MAHDTRYAVKAVRWAAKHGADTILHVGDFGYTFNPGFVNALTDELERHSMTLMFVDGNHEDFDYLRTLPSGQRSVRVVSPRIAHVPRGLTWEWAGKKWMGFGGAASVDRSYRTEGLSWWADELINPYEVDLIKEMGEQVDYLVTHDAPTTAVLPGISYAGGLAVGFAANDLVIADQSRALLQELCETVKPHRMWCGHYHMRVDVTPDFGDRDDYFGYQPVLHVLQKDEHMFTDNMMLFSPEDDTILDPNEL